MQQIARPMLSLAQSPSRHCLSVCDVIKVAKAVWVGGTAPSRIHCVLSPMTVEHMGNPTGRCQRNRRKSTTTRRRLTAKRELRKCVS